MCKFFFLSFSGWLSMVSKDGRTAGHFSSVGEVSRALVSMFLVTDSVVGLKATSSGMCRTVVSVSNIFEKKKKTIYFKFKASLFFFFQNSQVMLLGSQSKDNCLF